MQISAKNDKQFDIYKNSFDYISIVAALQVMIAHTSAYIVGAGSGANIPMWRIIAPGPAVVVFFAISGFLTTASFERSNGLGEFYIKRAFRIYPALVVAILLPGIIYSCVGLIEVNWLQLIPFYAKKILTGRGHDIVPDGALGNGSLWTIFVQIQFYILTPLLYKILAKLKMKHHAILILFFVIINVFNDYIIQIIYIPSLRRVYSDTCVAYLYMYLLGMCVYIDRHYLIPILSNKRLLLAEIVLYILWHWCIGADFLREWTYINPLSALLAAFIALGLGYALGKHRCRYDISFGLFLWHLPITDILHCVLGIEYSYRLLLVVWFTSIVVALVNCLLIEKPVAELSKRVMTSKK